MEPKQGGTKSRTRDHLEIVMIPGTQNLELAKIRTNVLDVTTKCQNFEVHQNFVPHQRQHEEERITCKEKASTVWRVCSRSKESVDVVVN